MPVDTHQINESKWTNILATLSLDVAAPYISRMGLELPEGFRDGLRHLIEDFRARETKPGVAAQFLPAVFAWAEQQYGPTFADSLYQWGENVFEPTDGSGAIFLWSSIVNHTGYPGHEPLPSAPEFVLRVRAILPPTTSIYNQPPVTAWDRTVYERQGYDEFSSPMELVQSTMDTRDFLLAWSAARQELPGPEPMAAVKTWGTDVAERLGMPLERLGEPGIWPDRENVRNPA